MQHVLLCEPHLHRSQSVHSLSSSLPSFLISLAPSLCVMLTPCPPRRPSPLRGRNVFQPLSHSDFRCLLVLKSQHAELSPHVLVTLHPNALHEALCETEGILVSARATVDSSATPSEFLCRMLARAVASRCAVAWEYIHTRARTHTHTHTHTPELRRAVPVIVADLDEELDCVLRVTL
jgi:hypothetical protein